MSEYTPGTLSISDSIKLGWKNVFESQYGLVLLMSALLIGFGFVIGLIAEGINLVIPMLGSLLNFLASPLYIGLPYAMVRKLRGEPIHFSMMFAGFSRFGTLLLTGLVLGLGYLACVAPGLIVALIGQAAQSGVLIGIGGLFMFVGGIVAAYVSIRLYFANFIIMDNPSGYSVKAAVLQSWKMTKEPVAVKLFLLGLVLGLICLACILLLVLPVLIVGVPLALSTIAVAYELIRPVASSEAAAAGPAAERKFTCAFCGYSKSGLNQPICPECGARADSSPV